VEVTEALRGLIDAIIILTPADGELRIEPKGNLAAMLSAATNAKSRRLRRSRSRRIVLTRAGRTRVRGKD
jgi:hypothetical protein